MSWIIRYQDGYRDPVVGGRSQPVETLCVVLLRWLERLKVDEKAGVSSDGEAE